MKSMARRIAEGLIPSIGRKVVRAATGQQLLVDQGTANNRLAICGQCVHKVPRENGMDYCNLCGCNLALKTKFVDEKCPDQPPRW